MISDEGIETTSTVAYHVGSETTGKCKTIQVYEKYDHRFTKEIRKLKSVRAEVISRREKQLKENKEKKSERDRSYSKKKLSTEIRHRGANGRG